MRAARTPEVVVAVDQGTSCTKAIAIDTDGQVVARAAVPVGRHDPRPGFVEQDPAELYASVVQAVNEVLPQEGTVAAIGLSNQRESAVVWDRRNGEAVGPLLGWQDRRTARKARELAADGAAATVTAATGLPLDPMFSALKIQWLLDQVDPSRVRSRAGELAVGTLDSWLLFKLSGRHQIEVGNASRTCLLNIARADWDPELLELFNIPAQALPEVVPSTTATAVSGSVPLARPGLSVTAVLGDSHAALFAQQVSALERAVKITHGSGSSMMAPLGAELPAADGRRTALARTIAWGRGDTREYALEGTILSTGATLLWAAGLLGLSLEELDEQARSVSTSEGAVIVPAFAGLGAPWWDEQAEAVLTGFGLGTTPAHLARAAFDSLVQQSEDLIAAAEAEMGRPIRSVRVDGGPSRNDWLMQEQADLSDRTVQRNNFPELSALGAASMAGLVAGVWDETELRERIADVTEFSPAEGYAEERAARRTRWKGAIERARHRPTGTETEDL